MRLIKEDIYNFILTGIYTLGISLSLLSFIFNINIFIKFNLLFSLLSVVILFKYETKHNYNLYLYSILLLLFFFLSSFLVDRFGWRFITPLQFIFSGLGFSMILLSYRIYSISGYIVFYGLAFYFLVLMTMGVSGDQALKWSSSNGISTLMLIACISLYIISNFEKKEIDLYPALLTLLISIWGIGRSGIISSFVLFIGLILIKFWHKRKIVYFIFTFFIFLSTMIYYFSDIFINFSLNNNFLSNAVIRFIERGDEFSESSARSTMWANYINNIDLTRFFFGVNVETDPWDEGIENSFNYHNSFIDLHLQTGIYGIFTMCLLFFSLFTLFKYNKVLFLLLLVLIIRSFTDTIFFFGRYDYLMYFFIFCKKRNKLQIR
jgi:hypothetical protein